MALCPSEFSSKRAKPLLERWMTLGGIKPHTFVKDISLRNRFKLAEELRKINDSFYCRLYENCFCVFGTLEKVYIFYGTIFKWKMGLLVDDKMNLVQFTLMCSRSHSECGPR